MSSGADPEPRSVGGVTNGRASVAMHARVCVHSIARERVSLVVSIVPDMWLLDSSCSVCHSPANGICAACVETLESATVPPLLGFADATVLFSYEGIGADLIRAIKYRNRRQGLSALVAALAGSFTGEVDAIVSVPGQATRRRERGYHVPDLMAARLSKRLKVPVVAPLTRVDDGSQQGRTRVERLSLIHI